jgi:hypothetical protein
MKSFLVYVFIVFCCLSITSCGNKKQNRIEQKREQYENAYNSAEELQEKAARDTNYAKSKEYSKQMEKICIEMSKKTFDMKESEKLLLEFEAALDALKECTDKIEKDPQLKKDKSFMEKAQDRAEKVLDYQQKLKKMQLNPEEKKKFHELCYRK